MDFSVNCLYGFVMLMTHFSQVMVCLVTAVSPLEFRSSHLRKREQTVLLALCLCVYSLWLQAFYVFPLEIGQGIRKTSPCKNDLIIPALI